MNREELDIRVAHHKCVECGVIAEYYYTIDGSVEPCLRCNAAPETLIKVIVRETERWN